MSRWPVQWATPPTEQQHARPSHTLVEPVRTDSAHLDVASQMTNSGGAVKSAGQTHMRAKAKAEERLPVCSTHFIELPASGNTLTARRQPAREHLAQVGQYLFVRPLVERPRGPVLDARKVGLEPGDCLFKLVQ